jgi:hypothetical protein
MVDMDDSITIGSSTRGDDAENRPGELSSSENLSQVEEDFAKISAGSAQDV